MFPWPSSTIFIYFAPSIIGYIDLGMVTTLSALLFCIFNISTLSSCAILHNHTILNILYNPFLYTNRKPKIQKKMLPALAGSNSLHAKAGSNSLHASTEQTLVDIMLHPTSMLCVDFAGFCLYC